MRSVEINRRIIKVNNLTVALEALQPFLFQTIRQPWALSSDIQVQAARRGLFTNIGESEPK